MGASSVDSRMASCGNYQKMRVRFNLPLETKALALRELLLRYVTGRTVASVHGLGTRSGLDLKANREEEIARRQSAMAEAIVLFQLNPRIALIAKMG